MSILLSRLSAYVLHMWYIERLGWGNQERWNIPFENKLVSLLLLFSRSMLLFVNHVPLTCVNLHC